MLLGDNMFDVKTPLEESLCNQAIFTSITGPSANFG